MLKQLATDTHGRTQTIISADPAEIMMQALQAGRQAPISVFREAMTFFIRLVQPNKTACRGEAWSVSVCVCLWLNNNYRK